MYKTLMYKTLIYEILKDTVDNYRSHVPSVACFCISVTKLMMLCEALNLRIILIAEKGSPKFRLEVSHEV